MTKIEKYVVVRQIAIPQHGVPDEAYIEKDLWDERVKLVHPTLLPEVLREVTRILKD
jgi:hypothetical protein